MWDLRHRRDVRRVGVKDAFVMGLSIFREGLDDVRIRFVAIGLQRRQHHAKAAIGHDGPLERRFGLQTDDHFIVVDRYTLDHEQ